MSRWRGWRSLARIAALRSVGTLLPVSAALPHKKNSKQNQSAFSRVHKRSLTGRTSVMPFNNVSRRRVMAGGASLGLVAAPFVRSANAAGSLTIGLWDHWVPGANDVQATIIKEWAEKEKVDVKVDFITSQGNKLLLTLSVEAQSRSGHDIMEFTNW